MSKLAQMICDTPDAFPIKASSSFNERTAESLLAAVMLFSRSKLQGEPSLKGIVTSFVGVRKFGENAELNYYCDREYPDVCVCGAVHSPVGSTLRYHCTHCQVTQPCSTRVTLERLALCADTPVSWIEWAVAVSISKGYKIGRYISGHYS